MKKNKFIWNYGENECQKYYEAKVGDDYLIVFANKWNPNIWLGQYNDVYIHNKTLNDRLRKKQGLPIGCDVSKLLRNHILRSDDPGYMIKKVEWCYTHNISEISQ